MPVSDAALAEILRRALTAELPAVGVKVRCIDGDMEVLLRKLYSLRRGFPAFKVLTFNRAPSAPNTELWVRRKTFPTDGDSDASEAS